MIPAKVVRPLIPLRMRTLWDFLFSPMYHENKTESFLVEMWKIKKVQKSTFYAENKPNNVLKGLGYMWNAQNVKLQINNIFSFTTHRYFKGQRFCYPGTRARTRHEPPPTGGARSRENFELTWESWYHATTAMNKVKSKNLLMYVFSELSLFIVEFKVNSCESCNFQKIMRFWVRIFWKLHFISCLGRSDLCMWGDRTASGDTENRS